MALKITNITEQPAYNKTTLVVTGLAAAGGVWYGVNYGKSPLKTTGIAIGFGILGLITGIVFAQLNTNKNKADVGVY